MSTQCLIFLHNTSHVLAIPHNSSHFLIIPHISSQYLTFPPNTSHFLTIPYIVVNALLHKGLSDLHQSRYNSIPLVGLRGVIQDTIYLYCCMLHYQCQSGHDLWTINYQCLSRHELSKQCPIYVCLSLKSDFGHFSLLNKKQLLFHCNKSKVYSN